MLPRHLYNQNNKLFCMPSILTLCLKNVITLSRYNSDIRQSILTIFGGPFVKRFTLCYRTVVCLSVYPVCGHTIDMGRKLGALGSHLTQSRLGRGLPPYQVASYSIQPFGYNGHGPKIGWSYSLLCGGELGPHLTQCGWGGGLPACQVYLDPSNRLAIMLFLSFFISPGSAEALVR